MNRLRYSLWSSQMRLFQQEVVSSVARGPTFSISTRYQSTTTIDDGLAHYNIPPMETSEASEKVSKNRSLSLPSPHPGRATKSPKLAALHARLALPKSIPLQTLARTLINSTADSNPKFNNINLARLGNAMIDNHVLEYLVCRWPRLPMSVLYAALPAYAGNESLESVARRWGVEAAVAPGEEVDPGLLQWQPGPVLSPNSRWAYVRAENERGDHYRRGINSRVVLDDLYGEEIPADDDAQGDLALERMRANAFASFVSAVVGAIYAHTGAVSAKAFVKSHILSRTVAIDRMFEFLLPTRELAMLCAREGFQPPRARLESETGRRSRTPVFIVGIYSGEEKLGEGTGASLDSARRIASMNTLKAWYLYSPGDKVNVPTDTMQPDAKPWKAPYIDIGEII